MEPAFHSHPCGRRRDRIRRALKPRWRTRLPVAEAGPRRRSSANAARGVYDAVLLDVNMRASAALKRCGGFAPSLAAAA